jgi:DNA-binding SARP family transcriptional activator/tetratricopeptide (TPR) repeat protein
VRFRILGPVEIEVDGRAVTLARRQERCLLGILLLDPGRIVPAERLCALLWDDDPPEQARAMLRTHVTRVRTALAAGAQAARLEFQQGGYVLHTEPETVDAHRFSRLLDRAGELTGPAERERVLREALALWRGPALDGAATPALRTRLCADLEELRLYATEEALAAGLALGRHRELLAELADLTATHPTRERLAELRMTALYATGRTGEALDVYAELRTRLAEQLGLEPGAPVRRLQRAILRRDPPVGADRAARAAVRLAVRPAQLPPDLTRFTGRTGELDRLSHLLDGRATAVVISAITGTAGVGKTSLAIHWAHLVRDRFPDGQLYANLRGFDPTGTAVTPSEAVRGFLDALSVPAQRIPDTLDAQVGLYRSLLAGKRVLVVLDNARDPEQVRPLLPGVSGCLALVTSRNQLTGLVAIDGADPVPLDLLSPNEARDLLAARLGTARVAAEPGAVEDLIGLCARLPLALAVAAARAATRPAEPLAEVVAQLRSTRSALDAVTGDDTATDIRAVFACSYQTLSPAAARLFRLLGLHPGPDLSAPAAASLAGVPPVEVEPLLAELTRAHLVTEPVGGRYTFHDLLRAYARELARAGAEAPDATRRLVDHYLHTAYAAALVDPHPRDPVEVAPVSAGVTPEPVPDHPAAMAWFSAESAVVVGIVRLAAASGLDPQAWQLAWAVANFLYRQGHWQDFVAIQEVALDAAGRAGNRSRQAAAERFLGYALARMGRYEEAYEHLRAALDLHRDLDDPVGHAHSYSAISEAYFEPAGRYAEALDHSEQALDLYRLAGNRPGEASALDFIGWVQGRAGDYGSALVSCEKALTLHQELGNRQGEAATWHGLGYAHHHLGDHARAIDCYRHALALFRDLGDRYFEADVLANLADPYHATGDLAGARTCWQRALEILDRLEHPRADEIRAKLGAR